MTGNQVLKNLGIFWVFGLLFELNLALFGLFFKKKKTKND
jgi:hypothetical protein